MYSISKIYRAGIFRQINNIALGSKNENAVIEKVRFADRTNGEYQAVCCIAAELKQTALLSEIEESLDQGLKLLYETEKDIRLLKVLIPLTCMSYCNSDQIMIHPGQ